MLLNIGQKLSTVEIYGTNKYNPMLTIKNSSTVTDYSKIVNQI